MQLEEIIKVSSERDVEEGAVVSHCQQQEISLAEFADRFARRVVQGYAGGEYNYGYCDGAMNWLFGFMTGDLFLESNGNTLPDYASEAYIAFDSGEYPHAGDGADVDPVARYTDPAVAVLLSLDH